MAAAAVGVSYSDYLNMTPTQLKAASDGYVLKSDREAWRIGMYVRAALADVIGSAFSKNGNGPKYPNRPWESGPEEQMDEHRTEEQEALIAKLYIKNMARMSKNSG